MALRASGCVSGPTYQAAGALRLSYLASWHRGQLFGCGWQDCSALVSPGVPGVPSLGQSPFSRQVRDPAPHHGGLRECGLFLPCSLSSWVFPCPGPAGGLQRGPEVPCGVPPGLRHRSLRRWDRGRAVLGLASRWPPCGQVRAPSWGPGVSGSEPLWSSPSRCRGHPSGAAALTLCLPQGPPPAPALLSERPVFSVWEQTPGGGRGRAPHSERPRAQGRLRRCGGPLSLRPR